MSAALLTRAVLAGGRVFPAGTARVGDAAELIPDGDWWSESPTPSEVERPTPPPRTGKGSGVSAWRAYAGSIGIQVPDGATRDQIVALTEQ